MSISRCSTQQRYRAEMTTLQTRASVSLISTDVYRCYFHGFLRPTPVAATVRFRRRLSK